MEDGRIIMYFRQLTTKPENQEKFHFQKFQRIV